MMEKLTDSNEKAIKRVNYFDRQFLTVDEFTVEQNYHLEKYKIHNLMVHSKGIVTNFRLHNATLKDDKLTVQIYGCAIDNKGNEINDYGGYAVDDSGREIYIPYGCYVEGIYQCNGNVSSWSIYIKFADLKSDSYQYEIDENNILKTRVAEIPTISIKPNDKTDGKLNGSNATEDEIFIGQLTTMDGTTFTLDTTETKKANSILDDANFHGNVDVDEDLHVTGGLVVNKDISAESINGNNADFQGDVYVKENLAVKGNLTVENSISAESINGNNANFQGDVYVKENLAVKGNLIVENSISAESITANYIARKYVNNSSTSILERGDVVVSKYVWAKFEFPNFPSLPDLPSLSNKKILVKDSDLPELKEKIKNAIELEKMTEKENALIEVGDFLVKAQGISTEIKSEDKKNIGMHLINHITNDYVDLNTTFPDSGTILQRRPMLKEEICTTSTLRDTSVCGVVVGVEPISKGQIVYVAYSGVCCVKIDSNEVITLGDLLVTSTNPGKACKLNNGLVEANGAILGKALSDVNFGGNQIIVLLMLK